jgi:hypothetical protein
VQSKQSSHVEHTIAICDGPTLQKSKPWATIREPQTARLPQDERACTPR